MILLQRPGIIDIFGKMYVFMKNRSPLYRLVPVIVFILSSIQGRADFVRTISGPEGLSNNSVLSLTQDTSGRIWIGTCEGLNIWNGQTMLSFNGGRENDLSLSGNLVEKIHPYMDGMFWVVTDYGLDLVDDGRVQKRFTQFSGMYRLLSSEEESTLVLTKSNHLFAYDGEKEVFTEIERPDILKYEEVLSSGTAADGKLYILTTKGLLDSSTPPHLNNTFYTNTQQFIFGKAGKNEILAISDDGRLLRYDFQRWEYILDLRKEISRHGAVSDIIHIGEDYLVSFQYDGVSVFLFNPLSEKKYAAGRLPLECGVFTIMKDRNQDVLWVATDGHGLVMFAKGPYDFHSYKMTDFGREFSTPVRTILLDKQNSLWLGTKGDGIVRIRDYREGINLRDYNKVDYLGGEMSNEAVYALCESSRNLIWIGSEGAGIRYYSYTDGKIHSLTGKIPEELQYIHAFYESSPDKLWVSTVGHGVFLISLSGGTVPLATGWKKVPTPSLKTGSNFYFCLCPGADGSIWIGSRGDGLLHYFPDRDETEVHMLNDNLPETANDVWSIRNGSNGSLWLGTGCGLLQMDSAGKVITTGFSGTVIHEIRQDSLGGLWLSTNNGLVRYSPFDGRYTRYGYGYGLLFNEFSDGASFICPDGTIMFGGAEGWVSIAHLGEFGKAFTPPVTLQSLVIDGQKEAPASYMDENILSIPPGKKLSALNVQAIDFINGENYVYLYNLKQLNDIWLESSSEIPFQGVHYGEYTLNIKYRNDATGLEGPQMTLRVRIKPPFYATKFAKFIVVVLFLSIAGSIWFFISRRNERRRKILAERLEARRREEANASKIRLLHNFATQVQTPVAMFSAPCQKIIDYHHSDEYIRTKAEDALRYYDRARHTLKLMRELILGTPDQESLPEPVVFSLGDIFSELLDTYSELAKGAGVKFSQDIPKDLIWTGYPSEIISFTDLLLTNAFFRTEGEKRVSLTVSREGEDLMVQISMEGKWPNAKITSGVVDADRLIESLQQAAKKSDDLHDELRLAVCHKRIDLIGGHLKVSHEGAYSISSIRLPRIQAETSISGPLSYTGEAPALFGKSSTSGVAARQEGPDMQYMLVLSTHPEIIKIVEMLFKDEFRINIMTDASSFLDILSKDIPDIVICEWLGMEKERESAIRQLKENKQTVKIPVIMIAEQQGDIPADVWITLPIDVKALSFAVQQNLRRVASLEDYFRSSVSAYTFSEGKKLHREEKEFLDRLYRIIRSNLQNPDMTTRFIADEMHLSVRNLYAKLDGIVNITPSNIIREYRLAYSAQLLSKTKMTVDEIIFRSGFSNRGTFFKNFTARYNCTPKAYRRENTEV